MYKCPYVSKIDRGCSVEIATYDPDEHVFVTHQYHGWQVEWLYRIVLSGLIDDQWEIESHYCEMAHG